MHIKSLPLNQNALNISKVMYGWDYIILLCTIINESTEKINLSAQWKLNFKIISIPRKSPSNHNAGQLFHSLYPIENLRAEVYHGAVSSLYLETNQLWKITKQKSVIVVDAIDIMGVTLAVMAYFIERVRSYRWFWICAIYNMYTTTKHSSAVL